MYNIANVGWQLVHYTVYGTQKSDNGLGFALSIIAFLHPVNCIVDSPPSNICIILYTPYYGGVIATGILETQTYQPVQSIEIISIERMCHDYIIILCYIIYYH